MLFIDILVSCQYSAVGCCHRCPIYKNPTDYFMHISATTAVAAQLSDQFAQQVCSLLSVAGTNIFQVGAWHNASTECATLKMRSVLQWDEATQMSRPCSERHTGNDCAGSGGLVMSTNKLMPAEDGADVKPLPNLPATAPLYYQGGS